MGQLFTRRVIERIAENRILRAQAEGMFDGLPGHGRPIEDIDEPYDELWWVRKWMRRERLGRELLAELPAGTARIRLLASLLDTTRAPK